MVKTCKYLGMEMLNVGLFVLKMSRWLPKDHKIWLSILIADLVLPKRWEKSGLRSFKKWPKKGLTLTNCNRK